MLNQNAKYDQRFLDKVEPKFEFSNKPINRLKVVKENSIQNKTAKMFLNLLSNLLKIEVAIKQGANPSDSFKDSLLTKGL